MYFSESVYLTVNWELNKMQFLRSDHVTLYNLKRYVEGKEQ